MSYDAMIITGVLVVLAGLYFIIRKKEMRISGFAIFAAGLLSIFWGIFAR